MYCMAWYDVIVILNRKSIFVQWDDYEKFLEFRGYSRYYIVGSEVMSAASMKMEGL
jgi:hypothetical protein